VSAAQVREDDVMTASRSAAHAANAPPATSDGDHRIGPEGVAELLAVAHTASMALQVLEEAARWAREDLESVLRSLTAIDEQRRAVGAAARALDDAGARAAQHLRTVTRMTEAASRTVSETMAEWGAQAGEAALEKLDSWADVSRTESESLRQYRRDRWAVATALESLVDLREAEARRLQQLIERRAALLTDLSAVLATQAEAARSIPEHPA
jgi:hypothetical protein